MRLSEECGGGDIEVDPPAECPNTPCACHYTTDGNPDCILLSPDDLSTCSLVYNGTLNCDCTGDCVSGTTPPPNNWWRCKGDGTCCQAGVDSGCDACNDMDANCYKGYMANVLCSNNCTTTPPPTNNWWRCKGDGTCCQAGVDSGCDACNDMDLKCYNGSSAQNECAINCNIDLPTTQPPPSYSNCQDACASTETYGRACGPQDHCCPGQTSDIEFIWYGKWLTCTCCYC